MKTILETYFDRLWPICRSLTGEGNRQTLKILSELIELQIKEVPSGTTCFDWTVPPEWRVQNAWIKNSKGELIVDFQVNNLHLLGYSEPFYGLLSYEQLLPHLYSLPEQPDLIPYVTSYYKKRWGFCLTHTQLMTLDRNEMYEVLVDTSFNEEGGFMTVGEAVIPGQTDKEILFSTYICHPSLANNELSGPLVTAMLYKLLKEKQEMKYTYRFIFIPETIGAIYYLSVMGEFWRNKLAGGFVITCIGDNGNFTYKKSRRGAELVDRATSLVLEQTEAEYNLVDFFPTGSDERQYCSPGFNLPVGSLMRTMYGKYPEYHTSEDNKSFICFNSMEKSVQKLKDIVDAIEYNHKYINTLPFCEPQLGKRGLYPTLGSQKNTEAAIKGMMWILNMSDGENDLFSISTKSQIPLKDLYPIVDRLLENGILSVK